MDTRICHYRCHKGKTCCWLCDERCKHACTLKCEKLFRLEKEKPEPKPKLDPINLVVVITYAAKNQVPDQKWRGMKGFEIVRSKGSGPRNVLVETEIGAVVVPMGNVKREVSLDGRHR